MPIGKAPRLNAGQATTFCAALPLVSYWHYQGGAYDLCAVAPLHIGKNLTIAAMIVFIDNSDIPNLVDSDIKSSASSRRVA